MTRRNEDFDEFCDPDRPVVINYEDVLEARTRIKDYIIKTPCMASHTQREFGIYIHYKLEMSQRTGSFKERGCLNVLLQLPRDKKKIGVIIASAGNEAACLCYYALKLQIPIVVVLPVSIPLSKHQKCIDLGAKVLMHGNDFTEAQKHARAYAREKGLTYINSRDHPQILAGYGTLALEILEQAPFADAIIVPIGCGGLAAAVSSVVKHVKPSCLVYGVEGEKMPLMTKSLDAQKPVYNYPLVFNICGIANSIGVNAFANAKKHLDKVLLVTEDWITKAMLHLVEREKFVTEGRAACALAPIIGNLVPELKTKNVVCILTGGNVDVMKFNRCLQRGLAAEGRLMKFTVGVLNVPGAKARLMQLLAQNGYNVISHFVDNYWTENDTYTCGMQILVETKGLEHSLQLKRDLEKAYPDRVVFEHEPYNDKRICPCYIKKMVK